MRHLTRIVVHHSASQRSTTFEQIDGWHRAKGWDGCGYHYVVEADGTVKIGRPVDRMGAHAKGANRDTIGVCVVGDNTKPAEQWSRDQITALSRLLQALCLVFGPLDVYPHRCVGSTATECPGLTPAQWHAMTFPIALVGEVPIVRGDC